MNIETGEITTDMNVIKKEIEKYIPINTEDMNRKQKREMKVSLHDHKSKLGKILTEHRKLTKNQRRNLRKKLKKGE